MQLNVFLVKLTEILLSYKLSYDAVLSEFEMYSLLGVHIYIT